MENMQEGAGIFVAVRAMDRLLDMVQSKMTESFFEASESFFEHAGHLSIVLAAAIGLLYGIVGAIKADQLSLLLIGIVWVPILVIGQFVAVKLMSATRDLIKSSPSQFSSSAFLKCVGLFLILGGAGAAIFGVYSAIKLELWSWLWLYLGIFVMCELLAWLCLNPSLLNISIVPTTTAGAEAIGVLTFSMKALLKLVPIMFGVGLVIGVLLLCGSLISLFRGQAVEMMVTGASGAGLVMLSEILPLIGYLAFVIMYLQLDVILAILKVPGKLDSLRKMGDA